MFILMAAGIHAQAVAEEFMKDAREEQGHADKIAKRIVQLGGEPDFSPEGLATRSHSEYVEGGDLDPRQRGGARRRAEDLARAARRAKEIGMRRCARPRRSPFPTLTLMVAVMLLTACSSMTGQTAGENVDDAQITAAVKAKLAAEKLATLTRVGVETNLRTVYLTGVVDSEATRQRAAEIAWSVKHVNGVVNHLTVQQKG